LSGPGEGGRGAACPLCGADDAALYLEEREQTYWRCGRCVLIFLSPVAWLDAPAEKARYDLHRNDPADRGYRDFLSRLMDPLLARVAPGSEGLDFGSGPGPALSVMLAERGRPTACYDPFYARDESVWARTYDFITATEVFEHLRHPAEEIDRLFSALRPGGWLAVMTSPPPPIEKFRNWHYKRDATHVCFYSRETFEYIARRWDAMPEYFDHGVVLLGKRG
jgi:hypothetical protein